MQTITTIGLDIAKSVFQVHGVDAGGQVVIRRQLKRRQVVAFFEKLPTCLVGIEACASSHHWSRELQALGHTVRLMPPAYVKPYVKRQKNDMADAEAICEAVARANMRFVPTKTIEQQGCLMLHRTRHMFIRQQFGIVAPVGRKGVTELLHVVADPNDKRVSEVARACLAALGGQLLSLKQQIVEFDRMILAWHRSNQTSKRLHYIPGVGPMLATALVASVADPSTFRSARNFSAWIGLVPKQYSSGGKQRLGRSCEPHLKAEHMAAPTNAAKRENQSGAVHTWHNSVMAPSVVGVPENICSYLAFQLLTRHLLQSRGIFSHPSGAGSYRMPPINLGGAMKRRDFMAGLGIAAALPAISRAQQTMPTVGFLSTRSPDEAAIHTNAFCRGLEEMSYVEGRNVSIEYRWARGDYGSLPSLVAELISHPLSVIVGAGDPAARAAKAAGPAGLPLVFLVGEDPVRAGLATSMNRPGTATGVNFFTGDLGGKRLELLCAMVPSAHVVGLLLNPRFGIEVVEQHRQAVAAAAKALGRELVVHEATTDAEIDAGFAELVKAGITGLVVQNDPFFDSRRSQILALSSRHQLPGIFHIREYPADGGLMSYGASLSDTYRQLGVYTGKILRGAKPDDLPVLRPTRFELVINTRTAKTMGLAVPQSILVAADELIE